MNDKEYFTEYKKCFNAVFSSNTEDWAFLKDKLFRYQSMTDNMLNLLGVPSFAAIANKTVSQVAIELNRFEEKDVEMFSKQYEQITKNKKRGIFLEVMPYKDETRIFVVYKTPLINPSTNNFVGVRGQLTNLLWPHAIKTLLKMHQGSKGLLLNHKNNTNAWEGYPLNSMQHMGDLHDDLSFLPRHCS